MADVGTRIPPREVDWRLRCPRCLRVLTRFGNDRLECNRCGVAIPLPEECFCAEINTRHCPAHGQAAERWLT